MHRHLVTILWLATASFALAQVPVLHSFPLGAAEDAVQLLESTETGFGVAYSFSQIDGFEVSTPRGPFAAVSMPGLSHSTRIGEPKVPVSRKIFAVPLGSDVVASVVRAVRQEITLAELGFAMPLMPAQPSLSKSQRPEDVPFAFNDESYAEKGFGDRPIAGVEELGILRGLRLFVLTVEPVRYDPASLSLEVYNDLEIRVDFRGGDLAATRELRMDSASPFYEAMYRRTILNYAPMEKERDDLTQYPIGYIIVANPMFQAQLQPFIEWKTQQGFEMFVGYVGDPGVGSTTATIKNYIQGIYNAQTPKPTFVLFVGDVDQVPTYDGNTGGHVTDEHYVRLVGTDYMPEMYFGRFSARTTAELQPQIDKTLEYERYEMPDPSYLGEAVMIAGVDASHAPTYGNGQINYGTTYYFNAAHGILSHTYLYPTSGSSAAQIVSDVSNGVGYANYTAHGSTTSWSDPSFTITNINNLQNTSQYPTVVGNCCLTNAFDTGTCFGEAWLRAADKGAIGYIGGTNSTYWDEDFWWGVGAGGISANPTYESHGPGAYDGMFHDHGELFPEWYTTQYAFIMAGNLAVVEGGGSANYYWEIYSLMGDPSLSTYFGVPSANTVAYPPVIPIGVGQINVTAEQYSYVGLSKDGVLHAAGLVDQRGQITLEFTPFTQPGQADLVITRQNRVPVITTVDVIPNEGPYVVVQSTVVDDVVGGNGDGMLDIGENPALSVFLTNVGTEPAPSVNGTLSTTLPQITITNPAQPYGTLPAGSTVASATPYALQVGSVADGTVAAFTMVVASGDSNWIYGFPLVVHAPALGIAGYQVLDPDGNGNGRPDPGETVEFRVHVNNSGSGAAVAAQVTLGESDPLLTIAGPVTQDLGTIASGAQTTSPGFTVTFSEACPQAYAASFSVQLASNGGLYASTVTLTVIVGQRDLLYVDSDDEATEIRITGALDNSGVQYRRWNTFEAGMATIPLDTLRAYRTVLWAAGDQNTSSVTDQNRTNLATYLDEGGSLILTAENYLSTYGSDPFTTTYLHIASYTTSISGTAVIGEASDPVGDGVTATLSYPSGLTEYPDQVNPDASAAVVFRMQSSNVPVAIRYAGTGARAYKTMFFGAPLEAFPVMAIEPGTIQTVISRALAWAGGGDVLAPSVPVNVAMAGDGTLSWSPSSDNVGVDHYRVYRHTSAFYEVTGMPPHLTTAGTSVLVPEGMGDPNVNYVYRITAVDSADNESAASLPLGEFDFQMAR